MDYPTVFNSYVVLFYPTAMRDLGKIFYPISRELIRAQRHAEGISTGHGVANRHPRTRHFGTATRTMVAARLPRPEWLDWPAIMVAINAHAGELAASDRGSSVDLVDAGTAGTAARHGAKRRCPPQAEWHPLLTLEETCKCVVLLRRVTQAQCFELLLKSA